jgi:hypothetical protein
MEIYRFTRKAWAEQLCGGSLRFGRLKYYQLLEAVFNDAAVGDRHEGKASTKIDFDPSGGPSDSEIYDRIIDTGAIVGPMGSWVASGNIFTREVDSFISCWSTKSDNGIEGMGADYDSRVALDDPQAFADAIWESGVEMVSGSPVSTLFHRIEHGIVHYSARTFDITKEAAGEPSVFIKRPDYQSQAEYRFALFPKDKIARDNVVISCPRAGDLLHMTYLGESPGTGEKSDYFDPATVLADIVSRFAALTNVLRERQDIKLKAVQVIPVTEEVVANWQAVMAACNEYEADKKMEFDKSHRPKLLKALFALRRENAPNEGLDRAILQEYPTSILLKLAKESR